MDRECEKLAIKMNNTTVKKRCVICGTYTKSSIGPELFLEKDMSVVCWECGRMYEPDLVELLELKKKRQA